jgi:hypothetical protein
MRARIDTDDSLHPAEIIDRAYNGDFCDALKSRFPFCTAISDIENRLKHLGRIYIALRRDEGREENHRSQKRDRISLKAEIARFRKALKKHGGNEEIILALELAARNLSEPPPKTELPDLTDHEKRGGEPYLRELQRLLEIFSAAAELQAEFLAIRRGPKINSGVEFIVRRTADLFAEDLQRPFTIDHHKPFKPTEAFLFVRALVDAIDDVTDDSIVSAMRAERNARLKLKR